MAILYCIVMSRHHTMCWVFSMWVEDRKLVWCPYVTTLLSSPLIGIIPGPNEPPGDINTFLQPLVDDLIQLWNGVPSPEGSHSIRAALIAVTADLPAMRKLTQFLGHKANLGCSRCKFRAEREPGTVGASGRMCYFTPSHGCPQRKHSEVVRQGDEYKAASTKTAALATVKKNGVRYSELMRLPYIECPQQIPCTLFFWVW